jgi:PAS domain S-box-containing protein
MPQDAPTSRNLRRGFLALAAVITGGVAASFVLFSSLRTQLARDTAEAFERQIQSRHALIRETLDSYQECLFGLGLVFSEDESVTREEFRHATEALLTRHPGVLGLQWAPLVPASAKRAWEAEASAAFGAPLRILERAPGGRDLPVKDRPEYFPIVYAEPLKDNRGVIGSDAAASPMRGELARARASRSLLFSGLLKLVYETGRDDGIVIINPVIAQAPTDPTPRFRGYLLGIFRVRDLFVQPWRFTPTSGLDVMFVDESATRPDRRVLYFYNNGAQPGAKPPTEAEFGAHELRRIPLNIGGRHWSIHYRAAGGAPSTAVLPLASLGLGLGVTGLLAAYLAAGMRHTRTVEREVAERTAELAESRRQLDSLMQALPGMAFRARYDHALEVLYASQGALDLSGYPAADFTAGRIHFRDVIHPDDLARVRDTTRTALAEQRPFEAEYRIRTRDGTVKWVLSRGIGLYDAAGAPQFFEGLTIDVTAQKLAESERLALERKLLEGQKLESLGLLAGGIAHDFNNLLTSILGNAGIVRLALPPGNHVDLELDAIETGATRAAELCRQMLAYAGKGRFVVEAVDLSALTEGLVPLLEISIARKAVLHLALSRDLPAVMADATQLRQIVMNLVLNAVDAVAGRQGEIHVSTGTVRANRALLDAAVAGSALPEGDYVFLEVRDNGSGMPAEVLARIFDPFFTTKFAGRGLGLAAVLGIVRGHKGALAVASSPDRGSCFRLLVPSAPGAQVVTPPAPPPPTGWKHTGHALVIDDDEPVRLVASVMLKSFGFTVQAVPDGQSGLDAFRARPGGFAVILLDLLMPGLTGEQTLEILRTIQPDVRVLIISGFSESDVMQRLAKDRGPFKFLHKPFKRPELEQKLRELLG